MVSLHAALSDLWTSVYRLVDSTDDMDALRAHRLAVPEDVVEAERRAALVSLVLPEVVRRARAAYDGALVIHKGPEVARLYPDPLQRPSIDLDFVVTDALAAQRALVEAGFVEVGDPLFYEEAAHERPLEWPGLPVLVELHAYLNWPVWLARSPTRELLAAAVPSSLDVDGIQTLEPHHHVLATAAHAWAHGPMARVGDLVDVAALAEGLDRAELAAIARRWGVEGMWRTTIEAVDSVLFGEKPPLAVRTWARNLPAVRERNVLENHLGRWLGGFSALGPGGVRAFGHELARDLQPEVGETWSDKLRRVPRALRDAFVTRSKHDRRMEEELGRRR
jgi:hypothetical protein